MIIPSNILEKYEKLYPELELLKKEIDPMLKSISEQFEGFFSSRVKSKESFAQKIETAPINHLGEIFDLYAATIVVATQREVDLVESKIPERFKIIETIKHRKKNPSDFIYDDVHLHIQYQPNTIVPGKEYLSIPFELQLKTFLQYGWAKSTHDIIYKSDQLSWPHIRVAHQIRAMLEQSDQILVQIDKVADICPDNDCERIKESTLILKLLKQTWDSSLLPSNVKGLAISICDFLRTCGKTEVELEKEMKSGAHANLLCAKSLTPFQAILGILIKTDPGSLCAGLKKENRRIYISKELKDIFGVAIPNEVLQLSLTI